MLDGFALRVNASSPFMSEALALWKDVEIAKSLDLVDCCFESDNSSLVKGVTGKVLSIDWKCAPIIDDIIYVSSTISGCCFKWIPRFANLAVDCLANFSNTSMGPIGWVSNPPPSLVDVLASDVVYAREGVG